MMMANRIEKPTLTLSVETIPWLVCQRLVEEAVGINRPRSAAHVDRLTRDARAGRWPLTHQGIAFGPDGMVLDGQHRLEAHAKAKRDLTTVVCRYLTAKAAEEAMLIFDAGRARRVSDSLAIGGMMKKETAREATSVCVLIDVLLNDKSTTSTDRYHIGDVYAQFKEAVDWCIAALPEKRFTSPLRASFALGWLVDRDRTKALVNQVRQGVAEPGTAASLWNRAQSDGHLGPGCGTVAQRRDVCRRALRIIKAHIACERVPDKLYTSEETVRWFRANIDGPPVYAPQCQESAHGSVQDRAIRLMRDGREWTPKTLARKLGAQLPHVYVVCSLLAKCGEIKRVGKGVYVISVKAS